MLNNIPGYDEAQAEYDNAGAGFLDEEESPLPRGVEMAEYIVTVEIPVRVPKTTIAPVLDSANAKRIVELFLREATQNADVITRGDFDEKDDEFLFLEPTDPYEIDTKRMGVTSAEPYTNPFNARTIYRAALELV